MHRSCSFWIGQNKEEVTSKKGTLGPLGRIKGGAEPEFGVDSGERDFGREIFGRERGTLVTCPRSNSLEDFLDKV